MTSEAATRLRGAAPRLALVAGAGIAVAHGVNAIALDSRIYDLDGMGEGNLLTWVSVTATVCAAVGAALLALQHPLHRRKLAFLAVAFAYLSLDDLARVHERLGDRVARGSLDLPEELADQFEVFVFMPLFGAAFLIGWSLAPRLRADGLRLGLLVLAAAVASEILGVGTRPLAEDGPDWPNHLRVGLEEGLEVAGWLLVAMALLAAALAAASIAED